MIVLVIFLFFVRLILFIGVYGILFIIKKVFVVIVSVNDIELINI